MNGQLVIELASGGTCSIQTASDVVNKENDAFEIMEDRGVGLVSVIPMGHEWSRKINNQNLVGGKPLTKVDTRAATFMGIDAYGYELLEPSVNGGFKASKHKGCERKGFINLVGGGKPLTKVDTRAVTMCDLHGHRDGCGLSNQAIREWRIQSIQG